MHRILVTRAPHQASALADALRALGAEPILVPTIEITEPTTYAPLDEAIHFLLKTAENHQLCPWNVLVFTSANAVVAFGRRLLKIYEAAHPNPTLIQPENPKENPWGFLAPATEDNLPSQAYFRAILTGGPTIEHGLAHLISDGFTKDGSLAASMSRDRGMPFKVASIGPATGHALNLLSIYPDFGPRQSVAESLAETLLEEAFPANQPPPRFLLIRAEEARDVLPDALRKAGAEVTIVPAYRTVTPDGAADSLARLFASPETRPTPSPLPVPPRLGTSSISLNSPASTSTPASARSPSTTTLRAISTTTWSSTTHLSSRLSARSQRPHSKT